jgi:hypothetical protein
MAAERFYIYRCGKTDACAVTATKDEPWLMPSGIVTIHLGRTCFAIVARKNGRNCKRKQPSQ